MSDVNKVLSLVACGCLCLMAATSASADYVGVKAVHKDDPDTDFQCTQGNGTNVPGPLTVCNVSAMFSHPDDRLLSVGNADLQVFNGANPDVFYFHPFGNPPTSPQCAFLPVFPDLICTSFVTIGLKCAPPAPASDDTAPDGDFDAGAFAFEGHLVGGWFNANPYGGQGDAGNYPNLQVLFLQSSVAQGLNLEGDIDIFWLDYDSGDVVAETDVAIDCAKACPENKACDDGVACTEMDTCVNGVCVGTPVVCPDDGNPCTDEACNPNTGMCETTNNNDPGDDGDACTENDMCEGGEVGGDPVDCNDGNACTDDDCDSDTGCTHADVNCDDGDACTEDGCDSQDGCTHDAANADDGDACTDDGCDPDSGATHDPVDCNDNNACTDDGCDPASGCTHADVNCDDGDACTDDGCDSQDGCTHVPVNTDDDDACTEDGCDPDSGGTSTPIDCDDDNECTDDGCDSESGCTHKDNSDPCDDGDNCTNDDTCSGGSCDGIPKECPEGEVCDPGSGECVEAPSGFLDIIPGKCPNRLREHGLGFLKVSLVSGPDFDACDVNLESLLLVNATDPACGGAVAPRANPTAKCRDRATPFLGELCDCHNRRKDGLDDMDMRFKLSEVRDALCLNELPAGTNITLCLTGEMNDGTPINPCDCVIVDRPADGTPGPGGG